MLNVNVSHVCLSVRGTFKHTCIGGQPGATGCSDWGLAPYMLQGKELYNIIGNIYSTKSKTWRLPSFCFEATTFTWMALIWYLLVQWQILKRRDQGHMFANNISLLQQQTAKVKLWTCLQLWSREDTAAGAYIHSWQLRALQQAAVLVGGRQTSYVMEGVG